MTNTSSTPSSSAQWHTISPHTRPLTLTVLELTPLALTLSLSLTPPAPPSHTPIPHLVHNNHHTHASSPSHSAKSKKRVHTTPRGKRPSGAGGAESEDEEEDHPDYSALVETSSFKDLLSHGVVVSVNGQPWSRIYAHVSEDEDDDHAHPGDSELEWEDEETTNTAVVVSDEGIEEGSITRRRPRKPRFASSAQSVNDKELVLSGTNAGSMRRKGGKEKMDKDRAVVVVYGLSPGKEYEVELRVVGLFSQEGGDGMVSTSVLIPPSPSPNSGLHPRSRANSLRSRSRPRSRSNSLTGGSPGHVLNSGALSHTRSSDAVATLDSAISNDTLSPESATIIPTPVLNAVDTQTAQLRHLIATAHAEKEHLQTQIKEARRTSQRQEAALKVEIENVKKVIEKAGSMDLRSKQKALATQEQVKQAWNGAESAEKEANDVEMGLDTLESKLEALRIEVDAFQHDWKVMQNREEDLKEKDKKSRLEEDKKLTEVLSKIDKLKMKKQKKESERADLEKRLEELEQQKTEAEKKNNDERNNRKSAASYYAAGYGQHDQPHQAQGHHANLGVAQAQRSLSAHPSLNGLNGHYAAGPAYRPRGNNLQGYQPRFPSAGSTLHRPSPTQPSPTHPNNFYAIQHPVNPNSSTSPAFRPSVPLPHTKNNPSRSTSGPTPSGSTGQSQASGTTTGTASGSGSGSGVNAAALPFHPTNFPPSPSLEHAHTSSATHHTTMMPPQLQHRIYLPNVRPRPTPNFHPPPSVLAEQAQQAQAAKSNNSSGSGNSPALPHTASGSASASASGEGLRSPNTSPPAFPPLPASHSNSNSIANTGNNTSHSNSGKSPIGSSSTSGNGAPGPSLASIVTRAVLSPTSHLAQQSQAANIGNVASSVLKHPPPLPAAAAAQTGHGEVSEGGGGVSRKNSTSTSASASVSNPTPPSSARLSAANNPTSTNTNVNVSTTSTSGEFPPLSPTWPIRREGTPPVVGNIWASASASTSASALGGGKENRDSPVGHAILKKPERSASGGGAESTE
ncbi:uncharacterized protein I303_102297 [Kwoniella dejecticola CBS 10117]|uniref:Uncharacterized protein n=1 Tax=Kwoniella dejecticola CBS 10117 TaxID=1296121 RepID=A0A1A6ABC6_9TREE|nr:uncharacterized protein I303_01563 [Kwoniella dejecticola CBS 10117]OBR87361.1 hypothetical protein I303_01563 [Kwoniella dejecticola CBS 10117]